MKNIYSKVLDAWARYTNYDENQTSFNLASLDYTLHVKNRNIQTLLTRYDPSGRLPLIYAKYIMKESMKVTKVTVEDAICSPETLKETREMWKLFNSPEIIKTETEYSSMLQEFSAKIAGHELLGDINSSRLLYEFTDSLDGVISQLTGCRVELFKSSGRAVGTVENFSTRILVFETLAECLLNLDNASEGMYLCYIRHYNTAEGYFGFFIVSAGNILSISDRCNEAYMGQHQHSRNGRWTEAKKDNIFPYDYIFSYSEYDYKGYATEYRIDEDKLRFLNLTPEVYMPIVVAMLLVSREYSGKTPDMPVTYVNSLFLPNITRMLEGGALNLPVPADASNDLVVCHSGYSSGFSDEDIFTGSPSERFDYNSKSRGTVTGFFRNTGQIFVDLYGEGFVDSRKSKDDLSRLRYDALPETAGEDTGYIPEFIGTKDRMDMEVYRMERKELAEYIEEKMYQEYLDFGGKDAVSAWYRQMLENRIQNLIQLCLEEYIRRDGRVISKSESTYGDAGQLNEENGCYVLISEGCPYTCFRLNEVIDKWREHYRSITGEGKCTIWFAIHPKDWNTIERLCGTDVPKIMKGWWNERFYDTFHYNGNNLLEATDAVGEIKSPFSRRCSDERYKNCECDFSFQIGFAKREFNKLLKTLKKPEK